MLNVSFSLLGIHVHSAFKKNHTTSPSPLKFLQSSPFNAFQCNRELKGPGIRRAGKWIQFHIILLIYAEAPNALIRVQQFRWLPSESCKYDLLEALGTCRQELHNEPPTWRAFFCSCMESLISVRQDLGFSWRQIIPVTSRTLKMMTRFF